MSLVPGDEPSPGQLLQEAVTGDQLLQEAQRSPQEAQRSPQEVLRSHQEVPRSSQEVQRSPQEAQSGIHSVCKVKSCASGQKPAYHQFVLLLHSSHTAELLNKIFSSLNILNDVHFDVVSHSTE